MFFVDLLPIYLLRQVLSFFSIPLKLFTDGYHIVVISKDKKNRRTTGGGGVGAPKAQPLHDLGL